MDSFEERLKEKRKKKEIKEKERKIKRMDSFKKG